MDKKEYSFKTLETKYEGFLAPAFEITIGSTEIDNAKVPITELSVDIEMGKSAGGCRFTIQSQYDYENGRWANDLLDTISVGAAIIINAGYVKKEEIFYGFVDDFSIEYSSNSAPSLSVSGIDAKGYLMNARGQEYLSEKSASEFVTEVLNKCVSNGYAKSVTVGDITDYNAQLIQEEIDDYKFLCHLAEIYNMSFFVIDGEIIFDNLMSNTKTLITLNLGVSLFSFSKSMTLREQVGKVIVYGIDPLTKKAIKGEASDSSISGGGDEAADVASGYNSVVEKELNLFVSTPEECQKLAQARFDARAFSFVNGKGRCIGIPELIPGRYIKIEGLDDKSSDTYFVTKVSHVYSSENGYFTNFEVKGAKSK